MVNTVWKGQVTFGLVSFPVPLVRAAGKSADRFGQWRALLPGIGRWIVNEYVRYSGPVLLDGATNAIDLAAEADRTEWLSPRGIGARPRQVLVLGSDSSLSGWSTNPSA